MEGNEKENGRNVGRKRRFGNRLYNEKVRINIAYSMQYKTTLLDYYQLCKLIQSYINCI